MQVGSSAFYLYSGQMPSALELAKQMAHEAMQGAATQDSSKQAKGGAASMVRQTMLEFAVTPSDYGLNGETRINVQA